MHFNEIENHNVNEKETTTISIKELYRLVRSVETIWNGNSIYNIFDIPLVTLEETYNEVETYIVQNGGIVSKYYPSIVGEPTMDRDASEPMSLEKFLTGRIRRWRCGQK